MTKIKNESEIIKEQIKYQIKYNSKYPMIYSVIQFGFYDNSGFLLPPSQIRKYWDKEQVKTTCKLIYNMLKEKCSIEDCYFFIERHAPTRSSIFSKEEIKGRFHINIISSSIPDHAIKEPNRKMRRLMLEDSHTRNSIRRTNYNTMDDMKKDLFDACCRGADWVNRYRYTINTQILKTTSDLENVVMYSLKDYKGDVDFMDVCVFEASDYKNKKELRHAHTN